MFDWIKTALDDARKQSEKLAIEFSAKRANEARLLHEDLVRIESGLLAVFNALGDIHDTLKGKKDA